MVKRKSYKGFNWQGITENGDGTFTAAGKREKRRVLKALHEQGVGVRSKQNKDGTWTITPSGTVRAPLEKSTAAPSQYQGTGRRLRTRESGFPVYPRGGGRPMAGRGRPFPGSTGPIYGNRPRASGPSPLTQIGNTMGEMLRKSQRKGEEKLKKEVEERKSRDEINEKMAKERIEYEQKQQREQAQRQLEKDRVQNEAIKQQSGSASALNERISREEKRQRDAERTPETTRRHQEQRERIRQQHRQVAPITQQEQKIDQGTLQAARESAVKGE